MSALDRNRQPLLFMAAALGICLLSFLLLYRRAPEPANPAQDIMKSGIPEFNERRHLIAVNADSFTALVARIYPTAKVQRAKGKMQVALSGQGARTSDFYNDNPYLLKVRSDEFSIRHDRSREEIAAIFTIHTEGQQTYIRVPGDVLFQLTEKAANVPHG